MLAGAAGAARPGRMHSHIPHRLPEQPPRLHRAPGRTAQRPTRVMHGLILAGGEGSRLGAEGLTTPKPLVNVAGQPLLLRLVEQFATLGCETITCMLRENADAYLRRSGAVADRIDALATVVRCQTPSSLHSFVAGLARVPAGNVFVSMIDSIMLPNDLRDVYEASTRQ